MRIQLLVVLLLHAVGLPLFAQEDPGDFCFVAPHDQLCPAFPHDVPEFSEFFEYMVISPAAQAPFDRHAWQAFVALNWDLAARDQQGSSWREFHRRDDVLGKNSLAHCDLEHRDASVIITELEQSDGNPLVDRNTNYILYETRMNRVAADYIWQTNLHKVSGQLASSVNFPRGRDDETPASVFIKTAWTVLEHPAANYIKANGLVIVSADRSLSGEPLCLNVSLGLVGMHIVTKVQSGNGDEWVWATFEHRANAPTAADARDINAIYGQNLFPEGCRAPDAPAGNLLLYDASVSGPSNNPPSTAFLWSKSAPFAVDGSGSPLPVSQVVRCWEIFGPTRKTNLKWQQALKGTPLENYMLISAQWRGANISAYLEHGELPRFLSNVTMETYLQKDRKGSCLGCHAEATTAVGKPSDFTFVLGQATE